MNGTFDNQICLIEDIKYSTYITDIRDIRYSTDIRYITYSTDIFYYIKNIFLLCMYLGTSILLSFILASRIHNNIKKELVLLIKNKPYNYDFIEYSYKALDISNTLSNTPFETNYISIDLTPKGYVIMYYNKETKNFCYYNDNNTLLKYSYLEAVARQYTQYYKINNIFHDNNDISNNDISNNDTSNNDTSNNDTSNNDIFYNKKNKASRINDINQTVKNSYKYLGKITSYFKELQDNQLNLKYIGYLDTKQDIYKDTEDQIYCEYKENQLNTNFSYDHTTLIDFSNIDISNMYIDNSEDHYKCINYSTKFFMAIDLCKELVIIEQELEEKKSITWETFKKINPY